MILKADDLLNERYRILRVLSGKGGMGLVYEAEDLHLGDTVVIKQARFSSAESLRQNPHYGGLTDEQLHSEAESMRKAFEREAKLLRQLRHNALPHVHDYFKTAADDQFLVMEFIPGKDLEDLLRHETFSLPQVLGWADQILDALNYLHTKFTPPIIHRDIKPQNLKLMPNGQIVLLDFGLAKGAVSGMTMGSASIHGYTPNYAPLEQMRGSGTDQRSDIYSLAVTMHCLLTGQMPPDAVSRAMRKLGKQPDPLRPLHELNPRIPAAVSGVLQCAAALHQDDRYPTATAMREALRQAVTLEPSTAISQPKTELPTIKQPKSVVSELRRRIEIVISPRREEPKPKVVEIEPAQPQWFSEDLGNGVKLEMIYIAGGSFLMGLPEGVGWDSEHPQHRVILSPFCIGKFPVTQVQWQAVMDENPSRFKGDNLPVDSVTWHDAVRFCEIISQHAGKTYRLPTEAEWEYACRAGSTGLYYFGDDEARLGEYAWYTDNSGGRTYPVGQKQPNAWGLHDMHGNVWEWCQDWYGENYYRQSPENDPRGPKSGEYRVLRGGSWGNNCDYCRSAYRYVFAPGVANINYGFRVVCVVRTS